MRLDQATRRLNSLHDMTETSALVFLGLTVGCARCDDHKFEPIPQRDFFRLQAFFTPAAFRRDLVIAGEDEKARHEKALGEYRALTKDLGYAGAMIGKINVNEFSTYVAVQRDIAAEVLQRLSTAKVKGRSVKLRLLPG